MTLEGLIEAVNPAGRQIEISKGDTLTLSSGAEFKATSGNITITGAGMFANDTDIVVETAFTLNVNANVDIDSTRSWEVKTSSSAKLQFSGTADVVLDELGTELIVWEGTFDCEVAVGPRVSPQCC